MPTMRPLASPVAFLPILLLAACATTGPARHDSPMAEDGRASHYAQSMDSATNGCLRNPACYVQSGDEAVMPWLSPSVRVARTTVAVLRLLESAELARIEEILIQCAKEADFEVNEREYGPGQRPDDAECERVVRYENGNPVRRRVELGVMKHAVAFACVRGKLFPLFPDNISVEPRYGLDPATRQYALTRRWPDSLRPDIVIHAAGNPNKVQCVFDYKFPCTAASKRNPLASPDVRQQLERYEVLGNCPPAIITPQLGVSRG